MRILFITNYYPPSNYGWGYMQLCEEVADGLSCRGHDIAVLTSSRRDGDEIDRHYPVYRCLPIDPDWNSKRSAAWQFFFGRRQRERQAVASLHTLVSEFRPDVLFVWHAIGLPRVLLQEAERLDRVVVAYYLAGYLPELPDEYIAYWRSRPVGPVARLAKPVLSKIALHMLAREGKPVRLKYENVICVSDYVRCRLVSQKLVPTSAVVIHNGVDISRFNENSRARLRYGVSALRCLIAGRLEPAKGVSTAIDALATLKAQGRLDKITLTILGNGPTNYLSYLRAKTLGNGLQDVVEFSPSVPREQMPDILARYDVLILPSEMEALSRAMQEAMAMGLLVIGTTTGGSGELLVHEQTGLAFEAGSAQSLARQLERAICDSDLAARLAAAGQVRVRESFRIDQTISNVDDYLRRLVERRI